MRDPASSDAAPSSSALGSSATVSWVRELARTWPALVRSYGPRSTLSPRLREQITLAVAEGSALVGHLHDPWRAWLGPTEPGDADEAVLAAARASARAGRPVDTARLVDVLAPAAISAVRATVAAAVLSGQVGGSVERTLDRLRHPSRLLSPSALPGVVADGVVTALSVPAVAPSLGLSAVLRAMTDAAPPVPPIDVSADQNNGEANLLAHVLAEVVPSFLANALLRALVLALPAEVAVGCQAGESAASVRFGRGRVTVVNGIAPDVVVVLDGDIEPLMRVARGSLVRELTRPRV